MGWFDDRSTPEFKAKENAFYSDCQVYTTEIERCRLTEDNIGHPKHVREEARKERIDLENKRQELIDEWKQEYGSYDHDKAYMTRIDGSRIAKMSYGNYWVALEEQKKEEEAKKQEELKQQEELAKKEELNSGEHSSTRVTVQFTVDKNGSVSDIEVSQEDIDEDHEYDDEEDYEM